MYFTIGQEHAWYREIRGYAGPEPATFGELSVFDKSLKAGIIIGLSLALVITVLLAAANTAATLSILAFNRQYLLVFTDSESKQEREYAKRVLKLRVSPYKMACAFVLTGTVLTELIPLIISLIIQEAALGTLDGHLSIECLSPMMIYALWILAGLLGLLSVIMAGLLTLIVAELLPLNYAVQRALYVNPAIIGFATFVFYIWFPIIYPFSLLSTLLKKFIGGANRRTFVDIPRSITERFFTNNELIRFLELHMRPENSSKSFGPKEPRNVHPKLLGLLKSSFRIQHLRMCDIMVPWQLLHKATDMIDVEQFLPNTFGLSAYRGHVLGSILYERRPFVFPLPADQKYVFQHKIVGYVHFTAMIREAEFTTAGQHIRWRARDLTFDHIPVVSIHFANFCELLSVLRAGPTKVAIVAQNIPGELFPSPNTIRWTSEAEVSRDMQMVGVITWKALDKIVYQTSDLIYVGGPGPMVTYGSQNLSEGEKLDLASRAQAEEEEAAEKPDNNEPNFSSGFKDRVIWLVYGFTSAVMDHFASHTMDLASIQDQTLDGDESVGEVKVEVPDE